jgi:hypothetical protein
MHQICDCECPWCFNACSIVGWTGAREDASTWSYCGKSQEFLATQQIGSKLVVAAEV